MYSETCIQRPLKGPRVGGPYTCGAGFSKSPLVILSMEKTMVTEISPFLDFRFFQKLGQWSVFRGDLTVQWSLS